jgi:hypothetical protein
MPTALVDNGQRSPHRLRRAVVARLLRQEVVATQSRSLESGGERDGAPPLTSMQPWGLPAETLLERVQALSVAVVLRAAGSHRRQDAAWSVQEG